MVAETLSYLFQLVFNGMVNGSLYVLIALGLTLMFGVFGIPNFAHGQVYMIGAYVTWLAAGVGASFWLAVLAAVLTTAALGVAMDRATYAPVKARTGGGISLLLVAFALYELLGGTAELLWGPTGRSIQFPITGRAEVFGLVLTYDRIFIIVSTLLFILGIHLLVQRTKFGKALRALSQDEEKATTLGINSTRISVMTFAIGSGLAGVAGAFIGAIYGLNPYMGLEPVLKAFVIVVVGGMGSVLGAIFGGYLLGIGEAITTGYLQSEFSTVLTFALLYVLLLVRPHGIFGEPEER